MELLYLTDISQVQYVIDNNPQLLVQMRPITGDIVVAYELERLNIDFIDEWDYLDPDDIKRHWDEANGLSLNWWDENIANTEYEGFTMTETTRQEWVYPFEACLNARFAYDRILKENQISKISGYFLPSVAVIRNKPFPTHRAVRSISQAILFWLAEKNSIPIIKLESEYILSQGIITRKSLLPNLDTRDSKTKQGFASKTALVKYDTMTWDEFEAIEKSFSNMPDWQLIPITNEFLDQSKKFNSNKTKALLKLGNAWETYQESLLNYNGIYPEIFANAYLTFQFKRIWDEMATAAIYGEAFSTFIDTLQPSIIFFGHEIFTIERVLVKLAKKKNIPTIGLLHGGFGHTFGFRGIIGDADSIFVWNDIDISTLKLFQVNESRLYKIGCIRYEEKYKKYLENLSGVQLGFKNESSQQKKSQKDKTTILILTAAINSGFSAPVSNPRKHREVINKLLLLITAREDLNFIIKAHPGYDYYEIYRRMQCLNLPNLVFLETATLDEVLLKCDICIMLNYFTTAALEAMLDFKPVIYLNNAVYPLPEWEVYVPDFKINIVYAIEELEKRIDRLLTDPDFISLAYSEADTIIRKTLDVSVTSPGVRLHNLIYKIGAGQQIAKSVTNVLYDIYSNKSLENKQYIEIDIFLDQLYIDHSVENVLFTLSYIAGFNNLGITSISRIINVLQRNSGTKKPLSLKKLWWPALVSYINGYNNNPSKAGISSVIQLMCRLLFYPQKFSSLPPSNKNQIVKYIAKTFIMENSILVAMINGLITFLNKFNKNNWSE